MKGKAGSLFIVLLLCSIVLVLLIQAGQVVTSELSQWAKRAIANEQMLSVSPSSRSIAVLYFSNMTGEAGYNPLQKGMSVMLTTDLAKVDGIDVVERARLQAIMEEIDLGGTGLVDAETVPRVGRLLGARYLSGGDILKGSVTQLKLEPNLIDVPDGTIFNQALAEGDLADLIAIEKEILFEIIRLMDVTLAPDQKAALEKPLSASVAALMLLFKGIDASDHGNYSQASNLYKEALTKDPDLGLAQEALSEIETLGLTTEGAKAGTAEAAAQTPAPAVTAPEASGGFLKWTAIGLGVVAVAGGGYYAATAMGDDDEEDDEPPPQDPPTVVLTTPANGATNVDPALQDVLIGFSKQMDTSAGQVTSNSEYWQSSAVVLNWGNNGQRLTIHRIDDALIETEGSIVFTLNGFRDTGGLALNEYSFYFTISSRPTRVTIGW